MVLRKTFMYAVQSRKERPVDSGMTGVGTCIYQLYMCTMHPRSISFMSPQFHELLCPVNRYPYTSFHDTFVPLAMHTLTYVAVRFLCLIFRAKLAYSPVE